MKSRSRFLLFLLLFPLKLLAAYDLSVCAIFQNEAPFLREWIEFHRMQGVQHFYLYNNNSTDNFKEVLKAYVNDKVVTIINWSYKYKVGDAGKWNKVQCSAYMDCIKSFGKQNKWLAVIDIDEFLFCPTGESLPSFLNRYEQYGGVCAAWLMFGTSHVEDIPPGHLMIELLTHCGCPDKAVKTILQPKHVAGYINPHYFKYKNDKFAVDAERNRMDVYGKSIPRNDLIRINHYWTRTESYLVGEKFIKRYNALKESKEEVKSQADKINVLEDAAILKFVPELRKRMGFSNHASANS